MPKKRNCFYKKTVYDSDRFSITQGYNLLYVAWDDYDGEVIASSMSFDVVKQSIESCSYFVYPNGFYAGSMGSRNTLHFYSHGFEVFAKQIPLAGSIAEKMLYALSEDKLVPPEIISDRYVFYRVPEYLQSYIDYYG